MDIIGDIVKDMRDKYDRTDRCCICFGFKGVEFCLQSFPYGSEDYVRLDADMYGTVSYFKLCLPGIEDAILDKLNEYYRYWARKGGQHFRVGIWED